MQSYVIRIKSRGATDGLVECLRYAGLAIVRKDSWDLLPPSGIVGPTSQVWAEENAKRMRTFGFIAADWPANSK